MVLLHHALVLLYHSDELKSFHGSSTKFICVWDIVSELWMTKPGPGFSYLAGTGHCPGSAVRSTDWLSAAVLSHRVSSYGAIAIHGEDSAVISGGTRIPVKSSSRWPSSAAATRADKEVRGQRNWP